MVSNKPPKKLPDQRLRASQKHADERAEQRRRRAEELGIRLPDPLKPWGSKDTISKDVIFHFEKGEHPLLIAKKLNLILESSTDGGRRRPNHRL